MRHFYGSHIVTIIGLVLAYMWAGWNGLTIAALLMVLEISLSFDNAIVNAVVLRTMTPVWQQRFLTWGMLIAVFGMRLVFPIVIVSFATGLHVFEVTRMAFNDPEQYSEHVLSAHTQIAAFGGVFLLMVFLQFIFNEHKRVHWIHLLESRLAPLGKLESVELVMAMALLLTVQSFLPQEERLGVLIAGAVGAILYVTVHSITAFFTHGDHTAGAKATGNAALMSFLYLQLLDASFSLDGVVGAFAISVDVVIIMIGLGIGAMFVRSLTVYMVKKGTLENYIFLEHGAHYGIGALAIIMLVSTVYPVSEIVTGLIGVVFIGLSFYSSLRHNRKSLSNSQK